MRGLTVLPSERSALYVQGSARQRHGWGACAHAVWRKRARKSPPGHTTWLALTWPPGAGQPSHARCPLLLEECDDRSGAELAQGEPEPMGEFLSCVNHLVWDPDGSFHGREYNQGQVREWDIVKFSRHIDLHPVACNSDLSVGAMRITCRTRSLLRRHNTQSPADSGVSVCGSCPPTPRICRPSSPVGPR
jgi:hypothetical protein